MKHSRILSMITALSFGMTLSACGKTDKASQSNSSDISVQTAPSSEQSSGSSNILIAFFSFPKILTFAAEKAGVTVERLCLGGMPHGFGNQGGWIESYDKFLSNIFERT